MYRVAAIRSPILARSWGAAGGLQRCVGGGGLASSLYTARRFAFHSAEFKEATKELPKTPGGSNPYDLLDVTITKATTMDDLIKVFREKTRECHPDHGGTHDKMAELNAAKTIIKEHHESVLKKMELAEQTLKADNVYSKGSPAGRRKQQQHDDVSRTGGINRRNVKSMNKKSTGRTPKEVESEWAAFVAESDEIVGRMCCRYEFALQQGRFFRKSSALTEFTVRERWLRKNFIKGAWETVHELRSDLLRKGARNAAQAQMAEEMVAFAGSIERRLNDNFSQLTQQSVQYQARLTMQRLLNSVMMFILMAKGFMVVIQFFKDNSLTGRFAAEM